MIHDWRSFLDSIGVDYDEHSSKAARGNIAIQCPWCGDADPSKHLGIRLDDGVWGCFRDPSHRGRSPARLIAKLKGCSYAEAKHIEGSGRVSVPDQGFADEIERVLAGSTRTELTHQPWPHEARQFRPDPHALERRFHGYLRARGFRDPYRTARFYRLRWAATGKWKYRLLIPIYDGTMRVGWTGRAIGPSRLRYRAWPENDALTQCLWTPRGVEDGGKALAVVEGPLDALKLDCYGRRHGLRAVAMMGLACGPERAARVTALSRLYARVWVIADSGAEAAGMGLARALCASGARWTHLPPGVGDPCDLSPDEARTFAVDLVRIPH